MNPTLARASSVRTAIGGLMSVATVTLAAASVVHFGVPLPLGFATVDDPFRDAAIPEAIIASVLAAGLVSVVARRAAAWQLALATTLFAVLGVAVGLSVVVRGPRTGDLTYHIALMAVLLGTAGLLVTPAGRRALS